MNRNKKKKIRQNNKKHSNKIQRIEGRESEQVVIPQDTDENTKLSQEEVSAGISLINEIAYVVKKEVGKETTIELSNSDKEFIRESCGNKNVIRDYFNNYLSSHKDKIFGSHYDNCFICKKMTAEVDVAPLKDQINSADRSHGSPAFW